MDNSKLDNENSQLSPHLFWDVEKADFNIDDYPSWIIQRVLEYGNLSDWHIILSHFGIDKIVELCKEMRNLDSRALSFISLISNTRKEDYRCYNIKQSNPTLWNS